MVDFFVMLGVGLAGGIVCFTVGYYQGYGGVWHRREHARLDRIMADLELELNEFSEAETQRFWDKMLGFEDNCGSKDHE